MQIQGIIHTTPFLQHSKAGNSFVEIVVYQKEEFRGKEFEDYFPVLFFKEKAESVVQEVKHGDLVMVTVSLSGQENTYQDKMTGENKVNYKLTLMGQSIEIYNRYDSKYSKVKAVQPPTQSQPVTPVADDDTNNLPF